MESLLQRLFDDPGVGVEDAHPPFDELGLDRFRFRIG
jgi:hypothetical protein